MKIRTKKYLQTAVCAVLLSLISITNTAFAEDLSGYLAPQPLEECEWLDGIQLYSNKIDHSAGDDRARVLIAKEDLIVFELYRYSNVGVFIRMELSMNTLKNPINLDQRCEDPNVDIYLADSGTAFDTFVYKTIKYNGRVVDIYHEIDKTDPKYRFIHILWSIEGKESCDKFRKEIKERKEKGYKDEIAISLTGKFKQVDGTYYSYKGWAKFRPSNAMDIILSSGGTGDELNIITENGRIIPESGENICLPENVLAGYKHTAYIAGTIR